MHRLSTADVRQACRVFLDHAYPGGEAAIPQSCHCFYNIASDRPIEEVLPPHPFVGAIGRELRDNQGKLRGFAFRLGSASYPHLKLKIELVERDGGDVWIYSVDTHDAFSRESIYPPPDHPDCANWLALQKSNRELKECIEQALEAAGLATFLGLLRADLAGH